MTSTSLLRNHSYRLLLQSCARLTLLSTVIYAITRLEVTMCVIVSPCGDAHSRCDLLYRISKSGWQLPVVIHNLKGYDGHLIVKALKSEFGKVRVIPRNMEKYLSLTVSRLKFINSFQITPQSLDNLAKTLEDDEFKVVRNPFPHTNLISSNGNVSNPITTWIASPDSINLGCLHRMDSLTNRLTVRFRTQSAHRQLECGLPLDESQWQTTTVST